VAGWPQAAKQEATQRREEHGAEAAAQATGIEEARSGEGPGQGETGRWPSRRYRVEETDAWDRLRFYRGPRVSVSASSGLAAWAAWGPLCLSSQRCAEAHVFFIFIFFKIVFYRNIFSIS